MTVQCFLGRAKPCGCIRRVVLVLPADAPARVAWVRETMRENGLRPQEKYLDDDNIPAPVACFHGPRRPER